MATDLQRWKLVHKYLPPALGPKAVRHYAPKMWVNAPRAKQRSQTID